MHSSLTCLIRNLTGEESVDFNSMEPSIIVADNLSPSETVQMDKKKIPPVRLKILKAAFYKTKSISIDKFKLDKALIYMAL